MTTFALHSTTDACRNAMKRFFLYISIILLLASCGGQRKTVKPVPESPEDVPVIAPDTHDNRFGEKIVAQARKWIGTPYKYGGESRKGTDCSGLTMVVYRDVAGIKIPRNSGKQQEFCSRISRKSLSPGDLVFFSSSRKGSVSHVGIYAGSGKFIHASSSRGVIISSLDEDYYRRHFHSAGRVPGTQAKKGKVSKDVNPVVETPAPRPFKFETVDHLPGREAPVVVTETVRVVEVRVDTVYIPLPPPDDTDSISTEVKKAF